MQDAKIVKELRTISGLMFEILENASSQTNWLQNAIPSSPQSTIRRVTSPSMPYFSLSRECPLTHGLIRDRLTLLARRGPLYPVPPLPIASFSSLHTLHLPPRTKAPILEKMTLLHDTHHT